MVEPESQVQLECHAGPTGSLRHSPRPYFVYRDHDGAITEQNSGVLPWGEPIQMFLDHDKIKIPESASSIASTGQAAMIDLVSISDDELELITRLRTSVS